jgi:type VI secretion system secreted protein VgrG
MIPSFLSTTRLYELSFRDQTGLNFSVEAWWGQETLSAGFEFCIDLLATDAYIELKQLLGQVVSLQVSLSDGTRSARSGLVRSAIKLGADGGFARYRIVVVPWSWLLTRARHNRVFQDKSVVQIVEAVFADYAEHAAWHWSDEVSSFLETARPRSYCVQYRESDYAFVSRLLAEEGIGWCVEEDKDAPALHRLRLFADSRQFPEDSLSQHANGGLGIRFHRADSQEDQDAIVAFGSQRSLSVSVATALAFDYKQKASVSSSVPTTHKLGGKHAPVLESYEDAGPYAFAMASEAERYRRLAMEAYEARYETRLGRGTVRTFRPGCCFDLVGGLSLASSDEKPRYAVLDVTHVGINNLSGEAMATIAQRLAGDLTLRDAALATADAVQPVAAPSRLPAELIALAEQRGYGNAFTAQSAALPWRPVLVDGTGQRINPRPTVGGPMTAVVVGPQGKTSPNGADELYCDALGRIKLCFHWQLGNTPDDRSSCWVRVSSRQAGAGMGWQWLPRIGQEVLVGFLNQDIDRPLVLGALFDGRGEGGVAATPGGAEGSSDTAVFDAATDHAPAGQGNLSAGNSPAWHGGAAASHAHAANLSGFKSKEFGGSGYNQLVLDDRDQQLRIQLKSTQHASELNLGHLVHQADNYRGSFRGTGAELRTDAWGAVRGGRGVLITSWGQTTTAPAGDAAPGMALLKQASMLAETLSKAAATHQTVQLAASIGSTAAGQSCIDPAAAPLPALVKVASGMVDGADEQAAIGDAQAKNTTTGQGKLPHLTDAAIVVTGKAGIGLVAGQHLQLANGETITLASGQDSNLAIAGKARIQSGQAIGLLAGAIRPGPDNTGIKLIAAKDDIDLQAQSDAFKLQAKQDLKLVSANANVDFAAAKKVVISVGGGASITIDGGITVQCPGTITVHAAKKSFNGPESADYALKNMPKGGEFQRQYVIRRASDNQPIANQKYRITLSDGQVVEGVSNAQGETSLSTADSILSSAIQLLHD